MKLSEKYVQFLQIPVGKMAKMPSLLIKCWIFVEYKILNVYEF